MHRAQELVRAFHKHMCIPFNDHPTLDEELIDISIELIHEEFYELLYAIDDRNLVQVADALGDLLYVVYGAAERFGLDMQPIFNEIHRSNMSKVGGYFSSTGKFLKPPSYSPPNLDYVISKLKERNSCQKKEEKSRSRSRLRTLISRFVAKLSGLVMSIGIKLSTPGR